MDTRARIHELIDRLPEEDVEIRTAHNGIEALVHFGRNLVAMPNRVSATAGA